MFARVTRALRAFFFDDVRVRREGGRLRLQLQPRDAATPAGTARVPTARARPSAAEERERQMVQRMRQELAQLLDADPAARHRMRHLAYVEQQLAIQGLTLLEKLSVSLLRQALKQLEAEVLNWSPVGLATLRSKMAVAVNERGQGYAEDPNEADAPLPADATQRGPAKEVKEEPLGDGEAALLAAYRAMRVGPADVDPAESSGSAESGRAAPAGSAHPADLR